MLHKLSSLRPHVSSWFLSFAVIAAIGLALLVSITAVASGNSRYAFIDSASEFFGLQSNASVAITTEPAKSSEITIRTSFGTATVSLPVINATPGLVSIPITVSDLSALAVISYDFNVDYDQAVITPASPYVTQAGTLSASMSVTPNTSFPGHLIVSAFQGVPVGAGSTLLILNFNVIGTPGQTSPLAFADYTDPSPAFHEAFVFNNGTPADVTVNGSVTVVGVSAGDGFDPNANGPIYDIVVQPDGKILIAGNFTSLSPNGGAAVTRNRIARLNVDGTLDTAFNPNADNAVHTITLQQDGKVIAGGNFSNIGGEARSRIARLNATTGAADSWNPSATGVGVYDLVIQADGKVLVGGDFSSIGGQTRARIARLDSTTGNADSWNPDAGGGSAVYEVALQADGMVLAGGSFTTIGGQLRNRIARLDPTTGAADSWNPNANDNVLEIVVQPDSKIVVSGNFNGASSIGGQTRNRVARLDPTTGLADTFDPNANNVVRSLALQTDGRILAGGDFNGDSSMGGQTRSYIARLNTDGTVDTGFNPNANGNLEAMAVQPDAKVLIGGTFTTIAPNGGSSLTRNRIARLETNGLADRTLDLSIVGAAIVATAVQPDGKFLISGNFTSVLGVPRNFIARLNADGTLDTAFNPNPNSGIDSIVVQADGKILVGGAFTTIGGQARNRIARLDAVTGAADAFNPNADNAVMPIAVQSDGKILVGGVFTNIGGQPRNCIARLDAVTGLADSFDPNGNGRVRSLVVQADGKILAGGEFTTIGGQTRNRIARLDAVTGLADSFDPNANLRVFTIALEEDGRILVGGEFTTIGGQTRNRIARFNAAGAIDLGFNPNANNDVYSIAVQTDGRILVGGNFNTSFGANPIGAQTRNYIARLDSILGLADSFNPNPNSAVYSVQLQTDGKVLVGGGFGSMGGLPRNLFARVTNDTAALQNLAVTQATVTWTRGGSSPQLNRVTFESSTDGVNYTFLGNGTAAGSNWMLTGLNLPTGQNIYVRARGFYRTGYLNASESIQESVRNAFINVITGTITYGNAIGAPVPPRFVKNVSLSSTAGSPPVGPVITGTPGTYILTGFGAGSYTIKPTKPGGSNGAITSNDAARVAQGVVSSPAFVSQNQRFAADVSGNGGVTSNDAALIARFAAGLTGAGNAGQWKFFVTGAPSPLPTAPQTYNDSRTYASVTSNLTGEDYVAILVGEVSGNWNPATHPRPGRVESGKWKVDSDGTEVGGQWSVVSAEKPITVTAQPVVAAAGKEIVVPISVEGVADKGVISYEFDVRYDPSVIQPLENPVDVAGTVSRGLMVVANPHEPGLLRVVVYGPMPIDENGLLLNLRFTAVGAAGSVSPLTFDRIMFNEGDSRLTVSDGEVKILTAVPLDVR